MGLLPWERVKREVLVRSSEDTSPDFGCAPDDRSVDSLFKTGLVCLNKPAGPTSHLSAEYVKKILGVKKAGHGGTLDPGVTGVLPVALQRSTRLAQSWLKAGKEYVVRMRTHKDVAEERIRAVVNRFVGKIDQLPPVKSAVKRVMRQRRIYYLELQEIDGRDVLFIVGCQAGTYIRKLVHDMGADLGGAHMAELVRTKAGPFNSNDWVTLQDLEDAVAFYKDEGNEKFLRHCVRPMEEGVDHLLHVWIRDGAVDSLAHGATLKVPGVARLHSEIRKGDLVAVKTLKGELVCIGMANMSAVQMMGFDKGVAVTSSTVLMRPGVYPRPV